MQKNVLEYLEQTVHRVPDKIAYANEEIGLTFKEVYEQSRAIGTCLNDKELYKEPIVVFMGKHPATIVTFYGVIYSGNYYVPIDEEMPRHRIELIFQSLNPKAVICNSDTLDVIKTFDYKGLVFSYEDMIKTSVRDDIIRDIRNKQIDTDPIYIVFTSGSTGVPKGVIACHRSVIDYIESLSEVLKFNEETVFGNQTPLYVDACLKELYPTLKFGATTYLIPKNLFMFPLQLVEFLNKYQINTVCWVVSALTMISAFGALDKETPKYLHTIAFGSEVFPIKQFKLWKKHLPNARFVNLYGPTEATGMSCYYEVNRDFEPNEAIPIGRPFNNTEIILLDENRQIPKQGEAGEICIRGTSLTLGYYKNFEKTNEVFIQNPLNNKYPELIYCTGDLGKYNDRGELIFISRKDNQIKHMGHRIELGEIEAAVHTISEVKSACCIFDEIKKKIVLYYVGDITTANIALKLKEKLPRYMVPNVIEALDTMPLTSNGKVNRVLLKEKYNNK
ncbi:amino acid adenylation domain-containing protein [Mobilitalea sibirica]|uniref:Amino acid adenylation domain-containing protein n=1 Tax=Mobilitalea sibirica TaxID=1462919 RepID=A0A8J7H0R9_9FIRM|nr:amino acid adenylation domain-containing protein [Mobilitalea sibirica]MBH1939809.1 amino acid adenylation domain-containing protein [Mobilitalea sibirica]